MRLFLAVFLIQNRAEIDEEPRFDRSALKSEVDSTQIDDELDAPPKSLEDILASGEGVSEEKEEENPFGSGT